MHFPGLWPDRWDRLVQREDRLGPTLSDRELLDRSLRLRGLARDGRLRDVDRVEGLRLVRETARRVRGTPHFAIQLRAGWALERGQLVEMQTGEGKTLTALLATYLFALPGDGCHVLTANDYLAERDAHHAAEILERLGMTVGWIDQRSSTEHRRAAYAADVTYATVTQVGFDLLRDRVRRQSPEAEGLVQRPWAAAVIDEADLVMLDEARTPLLLAVAEPITDMQLARCRRAAEIARTLRTGEDYEISAHGGSIQLTEQGCQQVLLSSWSFSEPLSGESRYQLVERALEAEFLYQRDRDYIVRDGKVAIVGSTTGRVLEGRQWQNGLQTAIEWKERSQISPETRSNGSITIQSLLNRYPRRCGMSGTLMSDRQELKRVYGLQTAVIPPRLPSRRARWPTRVFGRLEEKLDAMVQELVRLRSLGRPVLVGLPSIGPAEKLAHLLQENGLTYQLLTAKDEAREADMIAQAGQPGCITLATNMAGRGTDIALQGDSRERGGLHVIVAGLQFSTRTDRQLIGRCARQGDPGSYQEFLSCDDELIEACERTTGRNPFGRRRPTGELSSRLRRAFRRVQMLFEATARQHRWQLCRSRKESETWARSRGLDPHLEWLDLERAA